MIKSLLDEAISRWEGIELNCHPGKIPQDMLTGKSQNDWSFWQAIPSTVSNEEIREIEGKLGTTFSPQYCEVLQHRHFIELQIGEVSFFEHPSDRWKEAILKQVFGGYPKELLVEKGYLPFANYSDWGLWCFKVDEPDSRGEYPVYLWDHDRPEEFKFVADDLLAGLQFERTNRES